MMAMLIYGVGSLFVLYLIIWCYFQSTTNIRVTSHTDAFRNIISKGSKYRFPSNIDFAKCRREIAASKIFK